MCEMNRCIVCGTVLCLEGEYVFFVKQKTAYEIDVCDWEVQTCALPISKLHLGGEYG